MLALPTILLLDKSRLKGRQHYLVQGCMKHDCNSMLPDFTYKEMLDDHVLLRSNLIHGLKSVLSAILLVSPLLVGYTHSFSLPSEATGRKAWINESLSLQDTV